MDWCSSPRRIAMLDIIRAIRHICQAKLRAVLRAA